MCINPQLFVAKPFGTPCGGSSSSIKLINQFECNNYTTVKVKNLWKMLQLGRLAVSAAWLVG